MAALDTRVTALEASPLPADISVNSVSATGLAVPARRHCGHQDQGQLQQRSDHRDQLGGLLRSPIAGGLPPHHRHPQWARRGALHRGRASQDRRHAADADRRHGGPARRRRPGAHRHSHRHGPSFRRDCPRPSWRPRQAARLFTGTTALEVADQSLNPLLQVEDDETKSLSRVLSVTRAATGGVAGAVLKNTAGTGFARLQLDANAALGFAQLEVASTGGCTLNAPGQEIWLQNRVTGQARSWRPIRWSR